MARIELETIINAPVERVFDLCRSIDLHTDSAGASKERAVEGVTSGLIGLGDVVTWEARHLGVLQRLTVRITAFERPGYFEDEMVRGAFREMRHRHEFESLGNGSTRMTDVFVFRAPLGVLGRLVEMVLLERYMRAFLVERNRVIKAVAEGEDWRKYVGPGVG